MKVRLLVSVMSTLVVAAVLAGIVAQKERLLSSGTRVYFKLAPADPRSLLQGDYMALRYELANELEPLVLPREGAPRRGRAIITVDDRGVAVRVRPCAGGDMPGKSELIIRYTFTKGAVSFGAESFFFQEGQAPVYESARYGELVIDEGGSCLLAGLRDERLRTLAPPAR